MRYLNKHITIILINLSLFFGAKPHEILAQQDTQYTQYMYSANIINPAYAGSRGVTSITSQYRAQWTGIEGAPRAINFSSSGPLDYRYENMGLGATIIHETIGPSVETALAGDFSYQIYIDRYTYLNFGIKAGLKLINIDYNKLDIYNATDPTFQFNVENRVSPIAGAGVYIYSDLWYAGISVPDLLATRYFDNNSVSTAKERANFYAMGGYVFQLNPNLKFKPTALVKYVSGAPLGVDFSANFLINETFTLGASYRFTNAFSAITGFQINNKLFIGYSYDIDTTAIRQYNSGSHGVFLRLDIGTNRDLRFLTPRFF
ncbi:PorP/SprF family type IX secretion system membrane protein [Gaetbulibacter aestuarii]|uniref:Type IX secretion system membrane protein PorP/SprF n=1 Tax=Gaetbulibacter aestuarii TaxID=1502358 RepID=A0ABW7MUI0_9FLAO